MEDERNNIIKYIPIIIVGVIIFIIIVVVISKANSGKYLIIDDTLILEKQLNGWEQIKQINKDVLNQKYTVYSNDEKIENVKIDYASNTWYYLDKNSKDLDLKNVRVASSKINDIALANYKIENYEDSDETILKEALDENNITNIDSFKSTMKKLTYDLDQDGTEETIYTITNRSLSATDDKPISKMFLAKNGKISQYIATDTKKPYFVREIIDLNNDNQYELIVTKGVIDMPSFDSCYQIYSLKNNKWQLTHDCK